MRIQRTLSTSLQTCACFLAAPQRTRDTRILEIFELTRISYSWGFSNADLIFTFPENNMRGPPVLSWASNHTFIFNKLWGIIHVFSSNVAGRVILKFNTYGKGFVQINKSKHEPYGDACLTKLSFCISVVYWCSIFSIARDNKWWHFERQREKGV